MTESLKSLEALQALARSAIESGDRADADRFRAVAAGASPMDFEVWAGSGGMDGLTEAQRAMGLDQHAIRRVLNGGSFLAATGNSMADFQERSMAAQDMKDAVASTGQRLQVLGNGCVSLYHSTSISNAESIKASGEFRGNTWFSASKGATIEHARPKHGASMDTLAVAVDPRHIEFSTGTGEFYAPNGLVRSDSGMWLDPTLCRESDLPKKADVQEAPARAVADDPAPGL